jgi:hypothetical protein
VETAGNFPEACCGRPGAAKHLPDQGAGLCYTCPASADTTYREVATRQGGIEKLVSVSDSLPEHILTGRFVSDLTYYKVYLPRVLFAGDEVTWRQPLRHLSK